MLTTLAYKFENVKSYFWLSRYLRFIEKYKLTEYDSKKSHKHHILPRKQYPKYEKCEWNVAILPVRVHYICHYMLAMAVGGSMWFAFNNMNSKNFTIKKINSKLYANAMQKLSIESSKNASNKVVCKSLSSGKTIKVNCEEFNNNPDLVGITTGMFIGDKNVSKRKEVRDAISQSRKNRIPVEDIDGNIVYIDKIIFDKNIHKLYSPLRGKRTVVVIDINDPNRNKFSVSLDDPKYISGEYISINKGRRNKHSNFNRLKSPTEDIFEFKSDEDLIIFCKKENLSFILLKRHKGSIVKSKDVMSTKNSSKNTVGWYLE